MPENRAEKYLLFISYNLNFNVSLKFRKKDYAFACLQTLTNNNNSISNTSSY